MPNSTVYQHAVLPISINLTGRWAELFSLTDTFQDIKLSCVPVRISITPSSMTAGPVKDHFQFGTYPRKYTACWRHSGWDLLQRTNTPTHILCLVLRQLHPTAGFFPAGGKQNTQKKLRCGDGRPLHPAISSEA